MKRIVLGAAVLCLVSAAVAQTKVGYVDIDTITRKAKPVNSMMENISGEVEKLQQEIDTRTQKIRDLRADIKKNEGVLSSSDLDAKRKEVLRLENELQEYEMKAKRKAQEIDEVVLAPMLKKILFAVQDVAKEQEFDLILRGEAVLYGTKSVDLTDAVIARLDKEGGVTGAASDSKPPAAKSATSPASREQDAAQESDSVLPLGTGARTATKPAVSKPPETKASKPKSTPKAGTRPVDRQQD